MRVSHVYDSSFVLQCILHELELFNIIDVKEISARFDYDESSIYKLLKKISLNFVLIDSSYKVKRIGSGMYKLIYSSDETEEMEKWYNATFCYKFINNKESISPSTEFESHLPYHLDPYTHPLN